MEVSKSKDVNNPLTEEELADKTVQALYAASYAILEALQVSKREELYNMAEAAILQVWLKHYPDNFEEEFDNVDSKFLFARIVAILIKNQNDEENDSEIVNIQELTKKGFSEKQEDKWEPKTKSLLFEVILSFNKSNQILNKYI